MPFSFWMFLIMEMTFTTHKFGEVSLSYRTKQSLKIDSLHNVTLSLYYLGAPNEVA